MNKGLSFKVVVIGAPNAGKTALVNMYHLGKAPDKYVASPNMKTTLHVQKLQTRD